MPIGEEMDRYYAETQRGQGLALRDPGETIQSKLPVADGELILTQTRLYLVTGEPHLAPSVRLERAHPELHKAEGWLEIAPRMGVRLLSGQTGREFLKMIDRFRRQALERLGSRTRASAGGVRRRYDAILEAATSHGAAGQRSRMRNSLRGLHASVPERTEAAERLGTDYLEEGNGRAAVMWLAAARVFDRRFDGALALVERPRLPSREYPPPEWWIDRHLVPLLDLDEGPTPEQRDRIRTARRRILDHRASTGRAGPLAVVLFILVLIGWVGLLVTVPWVTLGVTTLLALAVGSMALWRERGRKRKRRR